MKIPKTNEFKMTVWSVIYYFCLMCSYFIIKPIRDEMGVASGIENLQLLFSGTFFVMILIVPLFGWISSRYPREKFLPYVYIFFILNIIIFFALFKSDITHVYIARIFYIWVSVYNLFVVSVFWSFLSEIFTPDQAKRQFAIIASGGTAGGIVGPTLTTFLVPVLGTDNLLLVSAMFLGIALFSVTRLHSWHLKVLNANKISDPTNNMNKSHSIRMPGRLLDGVRQVARSPYLIGICSLMLLYTSLSTVLYFQQLTIVDSLYDDPAERTALFSIIELLTNSLTLFFQLVLTRYAVKKFGIATILALVPFMLCFGFIALSVMPVLGVIITVQVMRRSGNYALTRPVREMLYVVLSKEEKYKAKNFIDTTIYRGGDMASAWVYTGLSAGLGLSLSAIALVAVPVCVLWTVIAYKLGKSQEKLTVKKAIQERVFTTGEQTLPPGL